MTLTQANERDRRGAAMGIFLGALARLLGMTIVLSAAVLFIAQWTSGTNRLSLFVGFGCVALVTLLVSVLECLAYARWALFAAVASIATELTVSNLVLPHAVPGAALIAGTLVGILLTLPPLLLLLVRPGRGSLPACGSNKLTPWQVLRRARLADGFATSWEAPLARCSS